MIVKNLELIANRVGCIPIVHRLTKGKISGPLHRIMSRLYPDTIDIEVLPGVVQKIKTDKYDSLGIHLRVYESDIRQLMSKIVHDGDTVIDCGANIGYHTLLLSALVGEKGQVYAIEPYPPNYEILKTNLIQNEITNTYTFPCAAGGPEGSEILNKLYISETNNGMHSLLYKRSEKFVSVRVRELADFFMAPVDIKLLKLDIEGMELDALFGLGRLIYNVENIIFEHLPDYGDGIFDYLQMKGFKISKINETNYLATGRKQCSK